MLIRQRLKKIANNKGKKGSTLIEVIIATAVISIAMTAILGLVTQSLVIVASVKQKTYLTASP